MSELDNQKDPELTAKQLALVSNLTDEQIKEIDQAILNLADDRFRKVAFIVGSIMTSFANRFEGIPDIYYSQRVFLLVENGELIAQGFVGRMRYCEVKRSL